MACGMLSGLLAGWIEQGRVFDGAVLGLKAVVCGSFC